MLPEEHSKRKSTGTSSSTTTMAQRRHTTAHNHSTNKNAKAAKLLGLQTGPELNGIVNGASAPPERSHSHRDERDLGSSSTINAATAMLNSSINSTTLSGYTTTNTTTNNNGSNNTTTRNKGRFGRTKKGGDAGGVSFDQQSFGEDDSCDSALAMAAVHERSNSTATGDSNSVLSSSGGGSSGKKKRGFRKPTRKGVNKLMSSMISRRPTSGSDTSSVGMGGQNNNNMLILGGVAEGSVVTVAGQQQQQRGTTPPNSVQFAADTSPGSGLPLIASTGSLRSRRIVHRGVSVKNNWSGGGSATDPDYHYNNNNDGEEGYNNEGGGDGMGNNEFRSSSSSTQQAESRKSVSCRRDNIDAKALTMGLDLDSANFLDFMVEAKCQEWLKSLSKRDPRACIKAFFDDVARDGADTIEEKPFQPELLSPLLSMFQRSSVFSVWRPTSVDSIRKMMTGQGTGKGLDIKGKSAKKGKLSAYVPFLQIHEDEHKNKIRSLPGDERIRIFYKKREARDNAHRILAEVLGEMTESANTAYLSLLESPNVSREDLPQDVHEKKVGEFKEVGRVLSSFRTMSVKGLISEVEKDQIDTVNEWSMDNANIVVVDDYSPKCYGLDMPKRLFWEGYVMRAKDITRPPGSVYDTGRPSRASFQDMNFASIKNEEDCDPDSPRAVVWQYTDPYLPPTEPDPDPMMPQTLLMAYEEHGRVMPVVSDFDCFLLGTRGVRFHNPLPEEQVELVHNMCDDIEKILKDSREGKTKNWTESWLKMMKHQKKHITMPQYGFGDPKSYAIMKYAVQRLEEFGAVRHGAECFNFYFPQELDDEFLVIGGNLGGAKYKYMKLSELQDFLFSCVDLGFTFPLNPKWVLCDEGWKALWDKLTGSTHPNVQLSINAWCPPNSGLRERIEDISRKNPELFQSDLSGRKKGTQAWDEAEIALDRYQRIQRAKRKLWCVLCWISIVQQSRKKVQAKLEESGDEAEDGDKIENREGIKSPNNDEGFEIVLVDDLKELKEAATVKDGPRNGADSDQPEKRVSFQDPALDKSLRGSVASGGTAESINTPTARVIEKLGELNAPILHRAKTDSERPSFHERTGSLKALPAFDSLLPLEDRLSKSTASEQRYRRSSSLTTDSDDNVEVIDSLLDGNLTLSEYHRVGLQQIRDQLSTKSPCSQPRINNRFERRHTSIEGRISAMMLEDVPSFILKEYGGAKGEASALTFGASVKKIMNAQRVMRAIQGPYGKNNGNDHFLPVEWTSMSKESKEKLYGKLSFDALSKWAYNMVDVAKLCDGSPLLFVGWAIIGSPNAQQAMASDLGLNTEAVTDGYNFISEFNVQMPILCSFLRTVEADYLPNPYHNNTHASDVVQTLNTMLQLGGKEYTSSPLDIFSILVAAVIHDVKHPGLNNNFQVNSRSELAVTYNDVSVLENFSIAWLFSKLLGQTRDFTVDIFSGLSREQFTKARSIIIRSVLETDMTHHFALLKKMGMHQEMLKGKGAEEWLQSYTNEGVNYDPSMDMLCFLLHQADISNPAKPYPLFMEWADSILSESYAQGDKESSLSLPVSPLCDRVTTDKKQSQIGFIKFVVQPSYQLLGEIIPSFAGTVFPHLEKSLDFWESYGKDRVESDL